MKVEEIPSGKVIIMTPELYQEFAQGGCVPACHLTNQWINIGDRFHLSPIKQWDGNWKLGEFLTEIRDVMLSELATSEEYNRKQYELFLQKDTEYKKSDRRGGCFRVNGKMVL